VFVAGATWAVLSDQDGPRYDDVDTDEEWLAFLQTFGPDPASPSSPESIEFCHELSLAAEGKSVLGSIDGVRLPPAAVAERLLPEICPNEPSRQ
jgi:hypothetical protein